MNWKQGKIALKTWTQIFRASILNDVNLGKSLMRALDYNVIIWKVRISENFSESMNSEIIKAKENQLEQKRKVTQTYCSKTTEYQRKTQERMDRVKDR